MISELASLVTTLHRRLDLPRTATLTVGPDGTTVRLAPDAPMSDVERVADKLSRYGGWSSADQRTWVYDPYKPEGNLP